MRLSSSIKNHINCFLWYFNVNNISWAKWNSRERIFCFATKTQLPAFFFSQWYIQGKNERELSFSCICVFKDLKKTLLKRALAKILFANKCYQCWKKCFTVMKMKFSIIDVLNLVHIKAITLQAFGNSGFR